MSLFAAKHRGLVELEIADYSFLQSILKSIERLNRILAANGEDLCVTIDNLDLVFAQVSPISAVDGKLTFVGKAPTGEELDDALALPYRRLRSGPQRRRGGNGRSGTANEADLDAGITRCPLAWGSARA